MIDLVEKHTAMKMAEKAPASGKCFQRANPERPVVGYWVGSHGGKTYVGKRVYSTGVVQGYATSNINDAAGYVSAGEALMDLDWLGYGAPWIQLEEYLG